MEEIDEVVRSDTISIKTLACERTQVIPQSHSLSIGDCTTANDVIKKNQFVVGINNVTRCLERDKLRAALVCLSARPPLVTQHLVMLSATRDCPVLALPNLSNTLSPLLGINSVLAIGFKVSNHNCSQVHITIPLSRACIGVRCAVQFPCFFQSEKIVVPIMGLIIIILLTSTYWS